MKTKTTLKNTFCTAILAVALICMGITSVQAAGDAKTPPEQDWPHKGMFGTYDIESIQRGYQVYRENCAACHGMKYLSYRNLAEVGFSEDEIKAIAREYSYTDGPNDEGEYFDRAGKPSDTFKEPYANDAEARYVNSGALPPDMSLLVKARHHGEDYIYALLTGYTDLPLGEELEEGQYWNDYMPGNKIAMPPPLTDGLITYSNGEPATLEQAAYDVTQFLAWASEPTADRRKQMGFKVLLYLLAFCAVMYLAKKKMWRDVK